MKRDVDLQTKIFRELEAADPDEQLRGMDGYSDEAFWYNARQLYQAGLIDIQDRSTLADRLACVATGLTPAGHDALDRARDKWGRKAKDAGGRAAQITFESVLRAILNSMTH